MAWSGLCAVAFLAAALLATPSSVCAAERVLAEAGLSRYKIIVPNSSGTATDYAAHELQTFLLQTTGAKLPILAESNRKDGPFIWVGPSKPLHTSGLAMAAKLLGRDGVLIKTQGKDVVLLGQNDHGHIFCVYTFLEKFAGCRFLAKDCTIAPKTAKLVIPDTDYRYSPPFIYRETLYFDAWKWQFRMRQRFNGGGMKQVLGGPNCTSREIIPGISFVPFAHSASYFVSPGKYYESHPEYFSLIGGKRTREVTSGQLCFTNPDVIGIITEECLKLLRSDPTITSVDISQNDSWPGISGACECETCRAVVKEENAEHGPILRLANIVADKVAKEFPGRYVDTLAYSYAVATPKVTKPRDNVIIRLCHFACYFHGIEGEKLGEEYHHAVLDWRKVAKNVFIWHYGVNFWSYLAPNPNLESLAKDFKYYHRQGINGVMLQGDIQSPGGELEELRIYLTSQLLWDPTQDPMKIRKDFCDGYYGPYSSEAMRFLATMDDWGRSTPHHIPMNGWRPEEITPPEFVKTGLELLEPAFDKAEGSPYHNRIGKLLLPLWFMQVNWPDKYGLAPSRGKDVVAKMRSLMTEEQITTISEGPANAAEFLSALEARYPGDKAP